MLDVTENGLSILRSERVELGERHLVRDKVLPKKESCSILFFSFMNQIVPNNSTIEVSFFERTNSLCLT